jgi:hypothetical protein
MGSSILSGMVPACGCGGGRSTKSKKSKKSKKSGKGSKHC